MWFVYALGGGWGHLTRAAALARAASPRPVRILANSPYAPIVRAAAPELDIVALDPAMSIDEARPAVRAEINRAKPACLVVDTFPRGLAGELTGLRAQCAKVLVHRAVNPRYGKPLAQYVERTYDLVIVPGEAEGGIYNNRSVITKPWIAGTPPSCAVARHGVVVCVSGRDEEAEWYGRVAAMLAESGVDVRCLCSEPPPGCPPEICIHQWPGLDVLSTARVVVGSGGYNTVHECAALSVPLIGRAWPRMYDDQLGRLRRAGAQIVEEPREAYCGAKSALLAPIETEGSRKLKLAPQGTQQAIALLERLLSSRSL